jgi:predicted nucleotidyltransferase
MAELFSNPEVPPAYETERPIELVVKPPVSEEILLNPDAFEWEIGDQIRERAAVLPAIQKVTQTLLARENKDVADALAHGDLSSEEVNAFYRRMTKLLRDDSCARLPLYIPFEFLSCPDENDSVVKDFFDDFMTQYLIAWWNLLRYRDNRADFTDGDLPDDRDAPIEMVVKAAHLLPELLERDVLNEEDIEWLTRQAKDDEILRRSIHEALSPEQQSLPEPHAKSLDRIVPGASAALYERELQKIMAIEGDIPAARRRWLEQTLRDDIVRDTTRQAASLPEAKKIAMNLYTGDSLERQIAVALYEQLIDVPGGRRLALLTFEAALEYDEPPVRAQSIMALRRLCRSGAISQEYLESLGVSLPGLAGNLSENITNEMTGSLMVKLREMADTPMLREYVYPVALVEGSQLKGYGTSESDTDIAMFIKPGTPHDDRLRLREELAKVYGEGVMEFWLDEAPDGSLSVHDFDEFDVHEADSCWTHTLFQSVWVGDENTIGELRRQLLPRYYEDEGDFSRYVYLRRMEQDIVQWRLMHKGYARCYPVEQNPKQTTLPDGDSVFWDTGYRLLATQLFAEKVFLPKR